MKIEISFFSRYHGLAAKIMKKRLVGSALGVISFCLFFKFTLLPGQKANYSVEEALKVLGLIDKIQTDQLNKKMTDIREVEITESEFNSYIAYRIETEREEMMKELRLKLLENNRLEGKLFIDLSRQRIPPFIRPRMNLYFRAALEVMEGQVKVLLKELFIENQAVQPALLDLIILIGSKIQNSEPWSLSDWHELPYGIKGIKTHRGRAVFYY